MRLFRSRKRLERNPSRGAACVWPEAAVLDAGEVRVAGGLRLPLADESWSPPDGWSWTGAVHLVDTTPRPTRRTRPSHRRYMLHVQLRSAIPEPPSPENRDEVIGLDAGVVVHVSVSDGREMNLDDTPGVVSRIRETQRDRSRCVRGSRRWRERTRRLRKLYAYRSGVLDNSMRHIALRIASTPGVKAVGIEATNNRGMVASAKGTATHPGTRVSAKRGLNRSLHASRYAGIRVAITRRCLLDRVAVVAVPAANTSKICHRCGTEGNRESQAVFTCTNPDCGWTGNADRNAAENIRDRAWETITRQNRRQGKSSLDGRHGETETTDQDRPKQTCSTTPTTVSSR